MRNLLTLAFFMFASGAAATSSDVTAVKTTDYAMRLPGKWVEEPVTDAGLRQYTNALQTESLSVSALQLVQPVTYSEISRRLAEYLAARLKSEHQQERTVPIELSTPKIQSQGSGKVASYEGFQPDTKRRFLAFIVANTNRLVCFYYEALDTSEAQFRQRAAQVIGSVQVAE